MFAINFFGQGHVPQVVRRERRRLLWLSSRFRCPPLRLSDQWTTGEVQRKWNDQGGLGKLYPGVKSNRKCPQRWFTTIMQMAWEGACSSSSWLLVEFGGLNNPSYKMRQMHPMAVAWFAHMLLTQRFASLQTKALVCVLIKLLIQTNSWRFCQFRRKSVSRPERIYKIGSM